MHTHTTNTRITNKQATQEEVPLTARESKEALCQITHICVYTYIITSIIDIITYVC